MQAFSILPMKSATKLRAVAIAKAGLSTTTAAPDHVGFVQNVAGLEPQPYLDSLLSVLQAKGEKVVSPYERKGLMPLAIPLSENPQDGSVTALLRWPTPAEGMAIPVVTCHKHGVTLLAKSMAEYIHRLLVEEDCNSNGAEDKFFSGAGELGQKLYRRGDFGSSGSPGVDVYLMKNVGKFPDVFERLALNHLGKGDAISALVTGEFYASRKHFPGFGRPFVFNAELLLKAGRKLESKDAAKIALKSPWWTLGSSYDKVAEMAGWGDEQVEFMRERVTEEGRKEDLNKGKIPAQIALDQAAFLLDLAAVDGSWDDTREQLASFYREAEMEDVANFIMTTSSLRNAVEKLFTAGQSDLLRTL
ncbi:hypothetical protein AXG93_1964s1020 [Marchantia polymorpha subsp. ruderalis]|uniref:Uncharacterized protein n=3 Tax=Marchantia polymorpha TaxID=3197 RepID=A0A176VV21_MARPO|nr:hypothetical protein AXG93_1964s1020 [Marchantia polymorpha subsp. ruderalis]